MAAQLSVMLACVSVLAAAAAAAAADQRSPHAVAPARLCVRRLLPDAAAPTVRAGEGAEGASRSGAGP